MKLLTSGLVLLIGSVAGKDGLAPVCTEDPNHAKGETWRCADGCSMCTCGDDGKIVADGSACTGPEGGGEGESFETVFVKLGTWAIITVAVLGVWICVCLCCGRDIRGRKQAKLAAKRPAGDGTAMTDGVFPEARSPVV